MTGDSNIFSSLDDEAIGYKISLLVIIASVK
jgi:hypothetical protein